MTARDRILSKYSLKKHFATIFCQIYTYYRVKSYHMQLYAVQSNWYLLTFRKQKLCLHLHLYCHILYMGVVGYTKTPVKIYKATWRHTFLVTTAVKVKQSHFKPWQGLRVPGGWESKSLRQSTHEGGKVVSPTHQPPLPPGNMPGTHFC
jgi:hypothetical protein